GPMPATQAGDRIGIDVGLEFAAQVAFAPHQPLQRLERGVLAVLVDPALQGLDHHRVVAHRPVLDSHHVQPAPHLGCVAVLAHEAGQGAPRVREQHVLHERDAAGRALDVGKDRRRHAVQSPYRGNRLAMSVPVKWPTQPSGSVKKRIATKLGSGPMSNQWVVESGTAIRSPCVHSTSYTRSPTCSVNSPEPATKKRTSSSLWKCSSRNFARISSRCGWSGAMLTTSTLRKPRSATRRSMSAR